MGLTLPKVDLDWPRALRHLARVVESRRTYGPHGARMDDQESLALHLRVSMHERTAALHEKIMALEVR